MKAMTVSRLAGAAVMLGAMAGMLPAASAAAHSPCDTCTDGARGVSDSRSPYRDSARAGPGQSRVLYPYGE